MMGIAMIGLLYACGTEQKNKNYSDTALTAPVDTLGADTSRENPVGGKKVTDTESGKDSIH